VRALWNRVSLRWCRTFHPEPSWPIHGCYHCPACLRIYPVPWHEGDDFVSKTDPEGRREEFGMFVFQRDRG